MFSRLNRDLVPMKAHYFFFNAATGPMMQFLPTFAKQLGFSASVFGSIYALLPITGLVAKPLFGGLADRFKLHKQFFIIFQIVLAIAFLVMNFIPELDFNQNATLKCNGDTFLNICSNSTFEYKGKDRNTSCHLTCKVTNFTDYEGMCRTWNIDSKYCNQTIKPEEINTLQNIEFDAYFNTIDMLSVPSKRYPGSCLEIKIASAAIGSGTKHKTFCDEYSFNMPCSVQCPNIPSLDEMIKNDLMENYPKTESYSRNFYWFLWASIVSWVGMAIVVSIADAICFNLLGNDSNKDYGKQRMWGSVGVGIFGISAGYLIDLFSHGSEIKDYSCIFYLMLIAMAFDVLFSTQLKTENLDSSEPSVLEEIWSIVSESRVLVFAWWCVGAGMCTGVVWNFLFWYTEEKTQGPDLEWIKTLQGLMTGVQCFIGEMLFNFLSNNILKKIGHINSMSLVLIVYSIRFMAYSLIRNPWLFLITEVLHGPSLGLCWPTMASYGDKVAPSGTKATIQGLVGGVFEGIGVSMGTLICGFLMNKYSGETVFRIFSVGALVWLGIFWMFQLILRKIKAYPLQQGHTHLASYTHPDDAILMTMSQEMQTY
ncbi:hypothetical protein TKK_0015243 [Trichogramma kaykai]|uniref:Major facilitator superfamily associated domain-containing protein n=1 Tax=Trichogramma kaykai TaxID=54128 RepID=A0ABD2WAU9_9HYME